MLQASNSTLWLAASGAPELEHPSAVAFVTAVTTSQPTAIAPQASQPASHALDGHTAIPLAALARSLATLAGTRGAGYAFTAADPQIRVNNADAQAGAVLVPGDALTLDGTRYTCILVNED